MRFRAVLLMFAVSTCVVSCGGDAQPAGETRSAAMESNATPVTQVRPVAVSKASGEKPGKGSASAKGAAPTGETPPPDAQFMIFCDVIRGPGHVQRAMEAKQELLRQTGRPGWHLIHSNDESSIYFGYYRTFEDVQHDPQEAARAVNDRKFIESLHDPLGDRRFRSSMFVPVNSPDPEAPSEWNLANTPPDSFWSLQVAAYQGSPERKRYAVELVREMRVHGIEAYYYHGDTISSVCIGIWPRTAVKEQGIRDDAHTVDPTQPLLVLSDKAPVGIDPTGTRDRDGRQVLIVAPRLEIQDTTLLKTIERYPTHAVNGMQMGKVANGQTVPDPSFLVQIPHDGSSYASGDTAADRALQQRDAVRSTADDAAAALLDQQPGNPQPQQQPARLRSIGGR